MVHFQHFDIKIAWVKGAGRLFDQPHDAHQAEACVLRGRVGRGRGAGLRRLTARQHDERACPSVCAERARDRDVRGQHQARLELRVAVVDSTGAQADVPVIPLFIDGPPNPPPGATFLFEETLRMRREGHRVVVAVYDQASGTMLSGTAEVSP